MQDEILRLADTREAYEGVADEISRLRALKQEHMTQNAEPRTGGSASGNDGDSPRAKWYYYGVR